MVLLRRVTATNIQYMYLHALIHDCITWIFQILRFPALIWLLTLVSHFLVAVTFITKQVQSFIWKWVSYARLLFWKSNLFPDERLCTRTCFENEVKATRKLLIKDCFYRTLAEDTITGRMYSSTKYWNWFLAPSFDSSWRRSPAKHNEKCDFYWRAKQCAATTRQFSNDISLLTQLDWL